MQFFRVKYLSFFFLLVSIFSFFNIIYSYYFNLYLNLNTYYFSLISSLIIGLLFYKINEIDKVIKEYKKKILIVCFRTSLLLNDKKFVSDFFKLSS